MPIPLDEIAKKIIEKSRSLSAVNSAKLCKIIACGNTLIELIDNLIDCSPSENILVLKAVLDEIFVDLHVSVTFSMGGQDKAACVMLRTCIEISLYILYFLDHPIEARIWADTPSDSNLFDMSFTQTLEKIANIYYAKAASMREPSQPKLSSAKTFLQGAYRSLSERVHGKYAFLQQASSRPECLIVHFSDLAIGCLKNLIILSIILSKQTPQDFVTTIPALEKYL
jgi:hypothetical protein